MKALNYNNSKRFLLFLTFVINVATLMLVTFFAHVWVYMAASLLYGTILVIIIANNRYITSKLLWVVCAVTLPIFTTFLLVFYKRNGRYLKQRKSYQNLYFRSKDSLDCDNTTLDNLKKQNYNHYLISNYYNNLLDAPVYQNSVSKYLPNGESIFSEILNELKNAKRYIFIEQYYISEGNMWNSIFQVLKQKAREGVEIKILYDATKCKRSFSDKNTFKKLSNYKMDVLPFKNGTFGFANHKKLIIIDGVVGFVGGANISDKYTQLDHLINSWEQSGLKITGDAAWGLTTMFLNDWMYSNGKLIGDVISYKTDKYSKLKSNEFVQPLIVSPLSNKDELKNIFLNVISNACEEINIMSSYIDIDDETIKAMSTACKKGVKVNIILSSISDNYKTFAITKGYYYQLAKAGVNLYEYNGGFVRSKAVVVDHSTVLMGSMNLDTRWLENKYEVGVLVHSKETAKHADNNIYAIKGDSKLITYKDIKERKVSQKIIAALFKLFRIN